MPVENGATVNYQNVLQFQRTVIFHSSFTILSETSADGSEAFTEKLISVLKCYNDNHTICLKWERPSFFSTVPIICGWFLREYSKISYWTSGRNCLDYSYSTITSFIYSLCCFFFFVHLLFYPCIRLVSLLPLQWHSQVAAWTSM